MSALEELKTVLAEVTDLQRVAGLLEWDQETQLPPGGVAARARELALVSRLAHERFVSDQVRSLLERAEAETQTLAEDGDDRRLVRVTRRDFDDATKLPSALVEEMARAQAESQPVWVQARRTSDWALYEPRMEVTVDLARRVADAFGYEERPMDALISQQEPGLRAADVDRIFAELRGTIVPLVREIGTRPQPSDLLDRRFEPADRQLEFGLDVARALGYTTERGRLDTTDASVHDRAWVGRLPDHHPRTSADSASALFRVSTKPATACTSRACAPSTIGTPLGGAALARRSRVAVAALGEPGGPEPAFWVIVLPRPGRVPRDAGRRRRSTTSSPPSTASSRRSSAWTPTR